MKFTVGTDATTVATLVASDDDGDTIVEEAQYKGPEMSVVIYNGHATETVYIEVGGKTATTTTAHPILASKSFSLTEIDLSKISLIAGVSNDAVYITITK